MTEKIHAALYVVATPIGHLGELTPRAQYVLSSVDVIAAEDTRNTQSLLRHFGIANKLVAVHEHNEHHAAGGLIKLITEGKSVALVTDAGTPAVSDPGARVVAAVHAAGQRVIPICGPSALIAAVSASGEGEGGFLFHGFLAAKSGERIRELQMLRDTYRRYPIVLYESPHRIVASMADIASVFDDGRDVVICRELTKRFESIERLPVARAVEWLNGDTDRQRGEFVLVLAKSPSAAEDEAKMAETAQLERTLPLLLKELPLKQAVALTVALTGLKKNLVYERALALREAGEADDSSL